MLIYIKTMPETDRQLRALSDELYGYRHSDKGLVNFNYAFTPYDRSQYEEAFHRIRFEITGTEQQIAFLKMIEADFEILRVEPTEGGETIEGTAIDKWHLTHTDRPLPSKVTKAPVVFRLEKSADGKSPRRSPSGIFGRYFYEVKGNNILYVSSEYSKDAYEEAKRHFHEIMPLEYDEIASRFEGAPADYQALKGFL